MKSEKRVQKASARALQMMSDAGFRLRNSVEVVVDENLPFMDYSTARREKNIIVISGMALNSGMAEGLLVHEMSHAYRTETNHPSHNSALLDDVLGSFMANHGVEEDYQIEIIQRIVNHVQDLYADDVTFRAFEKSKDPLVSPDKISDFFLDWIRTSPVQSADKVKDGWLNASIMLNNCFAVSNLERHKIKDVGNRVAAANQKFLNAFDSEVLEEFAYFNNFMVNLKEDVTDSEFRKQISEYVHCFLELTTTITS
jgi:hypothetical protein